MPYIPPSTATLLSESTPPGNKPVDIGLILLLVGVAIIATVGFVGWYMLAKYLRRRRGEAAEDVVGKTLDVETLAQVEPGSAPTCIDKVADAVKDNTGVVDAEARFSTTLTSAFKISVYDPDPDFDDDDDDESVLDTPAMGTDVEPMKVNFVCAERSVNVCHVIGSMESCHALVEEVPTSCEEPVLSEPLISAFKDAVYDDPISDEANDSNFSEDLVLSIEQVNSLDVEKSVAEVHIFESIQSCEAIVEEWTVPIGRVESAQPEAPVVPVAESTISDQVRQAPLALSSVSRSSRTANTPRHSGTSKAPQVTGPRSSYSERSRASGQISPRTSLVRTPARAPSSGARQETSVPKRTSIGRAPSTRPISSGAGTRISSSSQPAGPSRTLHRGSAPITTGKVSGSKRAPPAWRN